MSVLKIQTLGNGWIIAEDDNDETIHVIEDTEFETTQAGVTRLLEYINDRIGLKYDAWIKDNLRISWDKKGDEVEE